jgi:hypothetical protein
MRRIGLCCWEKACGSHGHAIDDAKRLPVRNDRVQPHSAHALRVSAFAKGATQRIDLEHRLQHARRVAKSTTQPLSDGRSARMSKRSVGRGGEEKGRGLIQAGEGCEARTDGGERLPIQELHCFAVATIVGLQLANCRMQIAREASSSVCRIFEGRGARGGSGGGHCVLSCGLPCRAEASLQIPDCKYRLQHAAERGAAGLGGESADLRLQPQTLLVSVESNLQVHTSLALKVATLSLQIADSFFLQRLQMGSARCHTWPTRRCAAGCSQPCHGVWVAD